MLFLALEKATAALPEAVGDAADVAKGGKIASLLAPSRQAIA
jgi:hypothetical protein